MIEEEQIVDINGKKYVFQEGYKEFGSAYAEVVLKPGTIHYGPWWDEIDDAHILCGKCKGDIFKVSPCNSSYESKAYCSCGNVILLHTG